MRIKQLEPRKEIEHKSSLIKEIFKFIFYLFSLLTVTSYFICKRNGLIQGIDIQTVQKCVFKELPVIFQSKNEIFLNQFESCDQVFIEFKIVGNELFKQFGYPIQSDNIENNSKNELISDNLIKSQEVIKKYLIEESKIKVKEDCLIGVGYNMCTDINFKAVDLLKVLQPQIEELERIEGKLIEAKVHSQITTLREFLETFAYQFMHGANAERVCSSKELFFSFLDALNSIDQSNNKIIQSSNYIGGHSAFWALKAQIEHCKVYTSQQHFKGSEQLIFNQDKLIWPKTKISQFIEKDENIQKFDTHLVFEYAEGDTILNGRYRAPRSNRFYFVHDPNGGKLRQLEIYHEILHNDQELKNKVQRHMFGGYQLLQRLSNEEAEKRLQKQELLWKQMKKDNQKHIIHIEFADFSDYSFFKLFEKYVVKNSNSIGMNEQEIAMLLDYWNNKDSLNSAKNSNPSFIEIIDQLKEFFRKQKELGLDISRVHLHPYGSFFMCYDIDKWHDARDAIIKSSMAVPKFCINGIQPFDQNEQIYQWIDNFELPDLPQDFDHPNKENQKIQLNKNELLYNFDLTDKIHCYLQFFIKCKTVYKTAGMGDTISGTGFIYHVPK